MWASDNLFGTQNGFVRADIDLISILFSIILSVETLMRVASTQWDVIALVQWDCACSAEDNYFLDLESHHFPFWNNNNNVPNRSKEYS